MPEKIISISKFLSYVLRHRPDRIGLVLDPQGWANIDELLTCAKKTSVKLSRELISEIVDSNDKRRFCLNADGTKIRASQGHSLLIDLSLSPLTPPDKLFHGTAARFYPAIRIEGLKTGHRQYVHLSEEEATARRVGSRHGKPIVLGIRSG
jgi:putative RNA 2'-phosphotransferase